MLLNLFPILWYLKIVGTDYFQLKFKKGVKFICMFEFIFDIAQNIFGFSNISLVILIAKQVPSNISHFYILFYIYHIQKSFFNIVYYIRLCVQKTHGLMYSLQVENKYNKN